MLRIPIDFLGRHPNDPCPTPPSNVVVYLNVNVAPPPLGDQAFLSMLVIFDLVVIREKGSSYFLDDVHMVTSCFAHNFVIMFIWWFLC